jgi:hypothetical protein
LGIHFNFFFPSHARFISTTSPARANSQRVDPSTVPTGHDAMDVQEKQNLWAGGSGQPLPRQQLACAMVICEREKSRSYARRHTFPKILLMFECTWVKIGSPPLFHPSSPPSARAPNVKSRALPKAIALIQQQSRVHEASALLANARNGDRQSVSTWIPKRCMTGKVVPLVATVNQNLISNLI